MDVMSIPYGDPAAGRHQRTIDRFVALAGEERGAVLALVEGTAWVEYLQTPPSIEVPAPRSTKSGPPESPLQIVDSVPGGPTGGLKFQQVWVVSETPAPEQAAVLTLPSRLTPESRAASEVRPNMAARATKPRVLDW